MYLLLILSFITEIDANGIQSDKPVKINVSRRVEPLFLERLFQVITVILIGIVLILIILATLSVVWYFCQEKDTASYDKIENKEVKEDEIKEIQI